MNPQENPPLDDAAFRARLDRAMQRHAATQPAYWPVTEPATRYFVDLDGGGDTCLWRGTGPDDPNCQLVVRKGVLDAQDSILWPTVVKALTGQADAGGGAS